MTDATSLPPLGDSSEDPSSTGTRSGSESGHGDSYTSSIQLQNLKAKDEGSGNGEGKVDSKQKRKRTSPKDQATLEAEYKTNPKPNKAARAEIVEKVELNEKEVQIWFQNRRQIQRRKQRPLLPHEIAAFGLGNLSSLSSDPVSGHFSSSSQSVEENSGCSHEDVYNGQQKEIAESEEFPESSEAQQVKDHDEVTKVEMDKQITSLPPLRPELTSGMSPPESSSFPTETAFKSFSSNPGYLANRWNSTGSLSTPTPPQAVQFFATPTISDPVHPSSCPERIGFSEISPPASEIRLSMSLDGKAELIMSERSPPSKLAPRPSSSSGLALPQKHLRGLHRSQSAFTVGSISPMSAGDIFPPRLPRGRSRDARSWQFACDAEARDELTTQAENESSGSAVAAISLLRSTSKSALKPNSNKRNATTAKHDVGSHGKKPKIARAQSSLARLQSVEKDWRPHSSTGKVDVMCSPSGDSDKENWLPHEGEGNARRRALPSGRPDKQSDTKPVLGDNFNPPQHLAHIGGGRNRKRKAANAAPKIFEDQENSREMGRRLRSLCVAR
ncbi:Homeobox YOX1 [Hyphodiscus hymeniophilus]|uniref:Homeobox YOX1 n=1 Tax=Hyphodiscus hymeniophilus TaxID=353542 RepID=A0A9P6VNU8_9HELO|nr:Homeobox YOX1 [Hyphodiscus hymeniophilus]